jgi:dihydrofolate reductase
MPDGTITLYIAASVDGFIADEDGGVDWLDAYERPVEDEDDPMGYEAFVADVDCLCMGATTYEQVLGFGDWPYGRTPTTVVTHRELSRANENVTFAGGDVDDIARRLQREYDHVWLVGGAQLARAFLRANRVDELRLHVVPTLLGDGVSLFGATGRQDLTLLDTVTHGNGIVELRYSIDAEPERDGSRRSHGGRHATRRCRRDTARTRSAGRRC